MKKLVAAAVLILTACSQLDMQGVDPKDFYAKNPIANKVETRYETHTLHFAPGANRLSTDDIEALRGALSDVSPLAAESVQVQMHPSQAGNTVRREHIVKLLRAMGYAERSIMTEPSEALAANDVQIDVAYAAVVSPHCPDWRTSPVTTYSNTRQGNIGCASVTNLGLMVADPRDLERGESAVLPDSERSARTISGWRAGSNLGPAGAAGKASAAGGAEPAAPAQ